MYIIALKCKYKQYKMFFITKLVTFYPNIYLSLNIIFKQVTNILVCLTSSRCAKALMTLSKDKIKKS